jgi:anaerobic magnesium-protoporphyrin IX monomethyl ester cyclase
MKKNRFKIALIDPVKSFGSTYIPTGLCYLSSYLKKNLGDKIDVKILSVSLTSTDTIIDYDPELVGFTSLTHRFDLVQKIAEKIKSQKPDLKLVLGGQHISMAPWSMPRAFDYAILGEGEEAFLRLVNYLLQNERVESMPLSNLQYWEDEHIKVLPKLPLIEPLDKIPFPDREAIDHRESIISANNFVKFNRGGLRSMQVTTSRGCPYKCKFCQPSVLWERLRLHSPEYIAEEIEFIHNQFGIRAVHIEDDLFITNKIRVAKLIENLSKKNLLNKIVYYVAGRTSLIDDEWVSLLNELGVVKVEFGIESGSDEIAKYLKTGATSGEMNKKAIDMLNQANISVYASFIAGSPPETLKDFELTRKMIKWIKNNHIHNTCGLNIATPLPGTFLWDYGIEIGAIAVKDIDWNKFDTLARLPKNASELIYLNRHIPAKKLIRKVRFINTKMWIGTPKEFIYSLPRRIAKVPGKFKQLFNKNN